MNTFSKAIAIAALGATALTAAQSAGVTHVREWRAEKGRPLVAELIRLVSLPNIASSKPDITKNADALTAMFEKRGFSVKRIDTPGSPILVAERVAAKPVGTLTFYMHYDGQPTDAKDWTIGQP